MPKLLFLAHRIPYPPMKGEKIRAFQILKHLCKDYEVHLGSLVDEPNDEIHIPVINSLCKSSYIGRVNRKHAKIKCLTGLLTNEALSVTFYRHRGLASWIRQTLQTVRPDVVFVYSSNMAPYVFGQLNRKQVSICDLVDVDSEKWRAYSEADSQRIMRWVHRREWRRVADLETRIVSEFNWSTFVTEEEAKFLVDRAPQSRAKVLAISNGVDSTYFSSRSTFEKPYSTDRPTFVFTGTMDYLPNVDAVRWFGLDILPIVQRERPDARFYIVGSNPTSEVMALASNKSITVTGRVPDVRPYLAHATAAVAPMRIARGIQNKVLEAMAMARPVVVTPEALEGIGALPDRDLLLADGSDEFARKCLQTAEPAASRIGQSARRLVESEYGWLQRLRRFDTLLAANDAVRQCP